MAGFNIFAVDERGRRTLFTNEVYASGKEAAAAIAEFAKSHPTTKLQPRPIEVDWRSDKVKEFETGNYVNPWPFLEPVVDHYLHTSNVDPSKVAYTLTPEHGMQGRVTRVAPGSYLSQYFKNKLSQSQIQQMVFTFLGTNLEDELKIARTEAEIQLVYETGPNSCMSHSADEFPAQIHPATVYASGDLGVAYITSENGAIRGRAVVALETKGYGRIYGDIDRMRRALARAGYVNDQSRFIGMKILKKYIHSSDCVSCYREDDDYDPFDDIPEHGYIMPYLDFTLLRLKKHDDHFELHPDGEYSCGSTSGVADLDYDDYYFSGYRCSVTGQPVNTFILQKGGNSRYMTTASSEQQLCYDVWSQRGYKLSFFNDGVLAPEDQAQLGGGRVAPINKVTEDNGFFVCSVTGETYPREELGKYDNDGNKISLEGMYL